VIKHHDFQPNFPWLKTAKIIGSTPTQLTMVAEFMVQPSSWIEQGITTQIVRGLRLFKFTEELQTRFEDLIEIHKGHQLGEDQEAELRGLQELDRIFTLLNAKSIAEA